MVMGMIFADNISAGIEGGLYRDRIIYMEQTKYQKIVMTKHRDDVRLYIDGNCQFSTDDEYRYHEALVHIPMNEVDNCSKVLILGGGDGLAVREVLKYDEVKKIDLVDLDEEMIRICSTNDNITKINENSLKSDKLSIHNEDAYEFLKESDEKYDLIIVDLPDPNSESLNKLYSNMFYRLCGKALSDKGVFVVQSTSPYFATNAFWCINKTIESEGFNVKPYHLQVPAFGDWGFNMASRKELTEEEKYNMEQAAIDRETKKKLQEKAQEEKMQNLPGDTRKKKYIRISRTQHKEIEEGQKPYIILKSAEHFKTGDIITAQVFEGGRSTGEVTELYITCLDDENTSSAINSGYVIAGILKKEVAADLGLLEDVEE